MWLIIVLVVLVILLLVTNIRVVPQATEFVIERLGTYYTTWETGLHLKVPLVDRVAKRISLKEQVMDFAPQPVITKDNVTMQIDTIVFYQVTDAKLYTYGVERPILAIESLTAKVDTGFLWKLAALDAAAAKAGKSVAKLLEGGAAV